MTLHGPWTAANFSGSSDKSQGKHECGRGLHGALTAPSRTPSSALSCKTNTRCSLQIQCGEESYAAQTLIRRRCQAEVGE